MNNNQNLEFQTESANNKHASLRLSSTPNIALTKPWNNHIKQSSFQHNSFGNFENSEQRFLNLESNNNNHLLQDMMMGSYNNSGSGINIWKNSHIGTQNNYIVGNHKINQNNEDFLSNLNKESNKGYSISPNDQENQSDKQLELEIMRDEDIKKIYSKPNIPVGSQMEKILQKKIKNQGSIDFQKHKIRNNVVRNTNLPAQCIRMLSEDQMRKMKSLCPKNSKMKLANLDLTKKSISRFNDRSHYNMSSPYEISHIEEELPSSQNIEIPNIGSKHKKDHHQLFTTGMQVKKMYNQQSRIQSSKKRRQQKNSHLSQFSRNSFTGGEIMMNPNLLHNNYSGNSILSSNNNKSSGGRYGSSVMIPRDSNINDSIYNKVPYIKTKKLKSKSRELKSRERSFENSNFDTRGFSQNISEEIDEKAVFEHQLSDLEVSKVGSARNKLKQLVSPRNSRPLFLEVATGGNSEIIAYQMNNMNFDRSISEKTSNDNDDKSVNSVSKQVIEKELTPSIGYYEPKSYSGIESNQSEYYGDCIQQSSLPRNYEMEIPAQPIQIFKKDENSIEDRKSYQEATRKENQSFASEIDTPNMNIDDDEPVVETQIDDIIDVTSILSYSNNQN